MGAQIAKNCFQRTIVANQMLRSKTVGQTLQHAINQANQSQAMPRPQNPLGTFNYRSFSDESNFDGHSDFASKSKVGDDANDLTEQIDKWVGENDVCLFMKGNRKMPRCGFSNYVVQIFKFYGVKEYKDVNVLESEALR